MENKKQHFDKFDEAKGLFWGASLFVGSLTSIIIGFRGNMRSDWLFAALIGICVFLASGLTAQGILTLIRKDTEKQ